MSLRSKWTISYHTIVESSYKTKKNIEIWAIYKIQNSKNVYLRFTWSQSHERLT